MTGKALPRAGHDPSGAKAGSRSATAAARIVIVVTVLVSGLHAWDRRRDETADALLLMNASAKALEFQVDRDFAAYGDVLADAAARIHPAAWPDPALYPSLRGRLGAFPEIDNVAVIGLDGRSAGGLTATGVVDKPFDASDREFFRYHLSHPTDGGMHIGHPFFSRVDGRPLIPLSRAIFGDGGKMTAVVRLAIMPRVLVEGLAAALIESDGSNALLTTDGTFLARAPEGGYIGRSLPPDSLLWDRAPHAASGVLDAVSPIDHRGRILSYRVLRRYPVVVVAGMTKARVYVQWRKEQVLDLSVLAVLLSGLYLFAVRLDRRERERLLMADQAGELRREVEIQARTGEAFRASRERLRAIADSLFEGVLVIDGGDHLIFANASARLLLGWDPAAGDMEGHPLAGLLLSHQAGGFVDFVRLPWRHKVAEGGTWRDDDAVFATAAGVTMPVAYACAPLKEGEAVRGAIISFRDIRALKEAQREALQASRLASVGQLAAGIAHEINTPIQYVGDNLRFIQGALAKLGTVMDAARRSGAAEVEAAAASVKAPYLLQELPAAVEDSLDGVAQIGRIVLSMKEFSHPGTTSKAMADINRAMENTLMVCRNTWKHVAELDKDLDPALPPVSCFIGELNQVFLNLIVNAAQAIETSGKPLPGRLSVSTARVGDDVEIRVADTGTGIPDSIRDRIFDPFFTTKEVGRGTGQGLAICRDVVVGKHGGRMVVDGRPGYGAEFIIRLPIDGGAAGNGSGAK